MRIDERLEIISRAVDVSGSLRIQATERYNGQAFQINDWQVLRAALKELLRQNWVLDSQFIQDFVDVQGSDQTPLLEAPRFNEFLRAVERFNSGIPIAIATMSSLVTERDSRAIYVELGQIGTPSELQEAIAEITELFNILSGDRSFRFGGFAHGSEWVFWIPLSELTGVAANLAILVAQVWFNMLAEKSTERLLREARAWNRAANGNEDTDLDNEVVEKFRTELAKDDLEPYWEEIERSLSSLPEAQKNEVINRIRKGAEKARQQMDKGRTFEVALNSPAITINGDNNSPSITINGDVILNIQDKEILQLPSPDDGNNDNVHN